MKTRILMGLCVLLGAGSISIQAADLPSHSAIRATADQKIAEPDRPQTSQTSQTAPALQTQRIPRALRIPVISTPAGSIVKQRRLYATSTTLEISRFI
jgi:hypothetical protein